MPGLPQVPVTSAPAVAPEDLVLLVTRAERLLSRRVREVLDTHGRSPDEWRVLCILADGAGHPMTEVAERAFLPPGTLTKLVDHLVDENLAYRRVDPMDRRRIRVYLSTRGRATHERVTRDVRAVWGQLPIGYADGGYLAGILTRLADALDG